MPKFYETDRAALKMKIDGNVIHAFHVNHRVNSLNSNEIVTQIAARDLQSFENVVLCLTKFQL